MSRPIAFIVVALMAASCSASAPDQSSDTKAETATDAEATTQSTVAPTPTDSEFIELLNADDAEAVEAALTEMPEADRAATLASVNDEGDTPLVTAARGGDLELFDVLAEAGADVNVRDADGRDVLNIAVRTSNPQLAEHAIAAGTDPTALTLGFQGSNLIFASERGEVEIVKMLIEAGAPLDRANKFGYTALIEATKFGDGSENYQKIVTALLDAGADPSPTDNEGKSSLDYAVEGNQDAVVKLLTEAA